MPDPKIMINLIDAEPREILCTFGLLNEFVRLAPDPNTAATIDLDPDRSLLILATALVPRSATGKPLVSISELEIPQLTPDEAFKLLDWVRGHLLSFFTNRLGASLQSINERKEDLEKIGSQLTGLAP